MNKTSRSLLSVECSSRCLCRLSGVRNRLSALNAHSKDETTAQSFANGKLKKSNHETRTRISFRRERRRERRRRARTQSRRFKRGDFCRARAQKTCIHSRHHQHHSKAMMMIKSRRWGKTKKTLVNDAPLPRFAPADYSSRRKKPHLSSRLVWDVTREDRRPAHRSPPFGGFRPAYYFVCVYN